MSSVDKLLDETKMSLQDSMTLNGESDCSANTSFTSFEIQRYQKRYEEGYDLNNDTRYNRWLSLQNSVATLTHCTSLSKVTKKVPTIKLPELSAPKTSSRIVTSAESIRAMKLKVMEKKKRRN